MKALALQLRFIAIAGLLTAVAAFAEPPAVLHSSALPADARSAFQVEVFCDPNGTTDCIGMYDAPASKNVVLEYVSGHCLFDASVQTLATLVVSTQSNERAVGHLLDVTDHVGTPVGWVRAGTAPGPLNIVSFGQMVRLYIDPSTRIVVRAQLGGSWSTNPWPSYPICKFMLSGYTIDVR